MHQEDMFAIDGLSGYSIVSVPTGLFVNGIRCSQKNDTYRTCRLLNTIPRYFPSVGIATLGSVTTFTLIAVDEQSFFLSTYNNISLFEEVTRCFDYHLPFSAAFLMIDDKGCRGIIPLLDMFYHPSPIEIDIHTTPLAPASSTSKLLLSLPERLYERLSQKWETNRSSTEQAVFNNDRAVSRERKESVVDITTLIRQAFLRDDSGPIHDVLYHAREYFTKAMRWGQYKVFD